MKINNSVVKLISELEYLIGHQCFNPNSYDYYTGDEGRLFRYPVWYTNRDNTEVKTKDRISDADEKSVNTMYYKFGSNHLYIGDALVKVLQHLEKRCGIDINELLKTTKPVKK